MSDQMIPNSNKEPVYFCDIQGDDYLVVLPYTTVQQMLTDLCENPEAAIQFAVEEARVFQI